MRYIYLVYFLLLGTSLFAQSLPDIDSSLLMKDIATLSSDKYEGRRTGTRGNRLAQFYILDRFKQIGLSQFHNTYEQAFYFQRRDEKLMGTNLYGYIKGKLDSVIVISAHYDHLGIRKGSPEADSIYNGADDNASGVGAMLAMAAYFKQNPPLYSMIFAALDAEEMGLQGAAAFTRQLPVSKNRIVLNINMDMVSHNDKNELYVCGTQHYPALRSIVQAAAVKSPVKLLCGHDLPGSGHDDWTNQSDHYEFHQIGIPFLYFGVEDHPDYHRASDEFEHITPGFYYHAVQSIIEVVNAYEAETYKQAGKELKIYENR
ncbi:peptidase M20 [Chitinophaga caeni]|uniref:Peptidase M20 n=1 Tax=Chitinophaga caeni TaxID=2029983 RepID=A0A291QRU8_9BACT|nr:M28 family peptidase [Chitinophaga caeni]ATL46612.1 peptidase M20 [Chitinophaga caeni]